MLPENRYIEKMHEFTGKERGALITGNAKNRIEFRNSGHSDDSAVIFLDWSGVDLSSNLLQSKLLIV